MGFLKKLYQMLFIWNIPAASDEELRTADAIVTQSCGRTKNDIPDEGNRILTGVVRKLQGKIKFPVLVQEELEMIDPELKAVYITKDPSRIGTSTVSWNTYEVAKVQTEYCQKMGWKKVIVVAIPDHMGRAISTYQKLGLETLPAPMPKGRYISRDHQQLMCRIPLAYRIREALTRLLFWYWGYI